MDIISGESKKYINTYDFVYIHGINLTVVGVHFIKKYSDNLIQVNSAYDLGNSYEFLKKSMNDKGYICIKL